MKMATKRHKISPAKHAKEGENLSCISRNSREPILIRVQPRAKRNAVVADASGALKVYVTAPPEDGRANEAVIELLAEHFGVKRRQIEIVSGEKCREKVVRIDRE